MRVVSVIPWYPSARHSATSLRKAGTQGAVLRNGERSKRSGCSPLAWALRTRGIVLILPALIITWLTLLHGYRHRLGGVIAQDIDHFDNNAILPRSVVLVRSFEHDLWRLPGSVGLPLIVKGIVAVVPIHGPVVDPLAPVRDGMLHIFGHIVRGQEEVLQLHLDGCADLLDTHIKGRQFIETDIPLLHGLLFQHLARDLLEGQADIGISRHLLGGLIKIEGEIPAQDIDAIAMLPNILPPYAPELVDDGLHFSQGNRRIDRANMHQSPGFDAMNPGVAVDGRGVIELQDEVAIAHLHIGALRRVGKFGSLPCLSLILAQILYNEGLYIGDREEPLTGSVDSEAPQVAGNPAPP